MAVRAVIIWEGEGGRGGGSRSQGGGEIGGRDMGKRQRQVGWRGECVLGGERETVCQVGEWLGEDGMQGVYPTHRIDVLGS